MDLVPLTVWVDGPLGEGSAQQWVEGGATDLIDLLRPEDLTEAWLPILSAVTEDDQPVVLAHRDDPRLRAVALFDALLNNADRKASHLIDRGGALAGVDHGVSLHVEGKLRTVIWGWAGDPLSPEELRSGGQGRGRDRPSRARAGRRGVGGARRTGRGAAGLRQHAGARWALAGHPLATALALNQGGKLGAMYAWAPVAVPSLPKSEGTVPESLSLYDTATRKLVPVGPADGTARMYVCGITPYDATHLGHANTYVAFDLLNRVWRDLGLDRRLHAERHRRRRPAARARRRHRAGLGGTGRGPDRAVPQRHGGPARHPAGPLHRRGGVDLLRDRADRAAAAERAGLPGRGRRAPRLVLQHAWPPRASGVSATSTRPA